MSFRIISAPPFVSEIEENPILEMLFGNESRASSFIKITKLSGSIIDVGNCFSVVPIVMDQSVKSIAVFVLL